MEYLDVLRKLRNTNNMALTRMQEAFVLVLIFLVIKQ